jgi:lysozyme
MPNPIVIDLSHHNVIPVSLKPAKAQGIIGVIHKASESTGFQDENVNAREWLAREAGLLFGLYHFIRPGNVSGQVDNFLDVYQRFEPKDLLIALDYEDAGVSIAECLQWMNLVEEHTSKTPIIYSGYVLKEKLGSAPDPMLNGDNYLLWLAQYGSKAELPAGWDEYWLWQYTDEGSVDGVTPPTDLNTGDVDGVRRYWTSGGTVPMPEKVVRVYAPPGVLVQVIYEEG